MANEDKKDFNAMLHDNKDMPKFQIITDGSKDEVDKLSEIYQQTQHHFAPEQTYHPNGEAQYAGIDDFTHSSVIGKYRVLEIWTKETRPAIWVHDWDAGTCGYASPDQRAFYEEKKRKLEDANIMKDENGLPVLDENGEPIYYVNERIRLKFGEEYGLSIDSVLQEGTCVEVWLPWES